MPSVACPTRFTFCGMRVPVVTTVVLLSRFRSFEAASSLAGWAVRRRAALPNFLGVPALVFISAAGEATAAIPNAAASASTRNELNAFIPVDGNAVESMNRFSRREYTPASRPCIRNRVSPSRAPHSQTDLNRHSAETAQAWVCSWRGRERASSASTRAFLNAAQAGHAVPDGAGDSRQGDSFPIVVRGLRLPRPDRAMPRDLRPEIAKT